MNEGVTDGRKKQRNGGEKTLFVGDMGGQRLGGHENVNLDVSEAIYSSLGIYSRET